MDQGPYDGFRHGCRHGQKTCRRIEVNRYVTKNGSSYGLPFSFAFALSILAEIGKTEGRRGLYAALTDDGGEDKDDDRKNIWEKVEDLHFHEAEARDIAWEDIKDSEDKGTSDGDGWVPDGEDDEGDGQPSEGLDGRGILPGTGNIVHDVEEAA